MSGLIWDALGKSLASASGTVGQYMASQAKTDEDRLAREAEREREREFRREMQAETLAARASLAGDKGSAGGKSGGLGGMAQISEGSDAETAIAAEAGMTVPEYRQRMAAQKTGDFASFAQPAVVGRTEEDDGASDAMSRRMAGYKVENTLPAGFESEFKEKQAQLAKLQKQYLFGKDYDQAAKGAQTQQEIDATAAIQAGGDAGLIGRSIAAGQGKGIKKVSDGTLYDEFTGEGASTAVGKSKEAKNYAGPKGGGPGGGDSSVKVKATKILENGNIGTVMSDGSVRDTGQKSAEFNKTVASTIARMEKDTSGFSRKSPEEQRAAALSRLGVGQTSSPGPAKTSDNAGGIAAPRSKSEFDALPSGTRFKAPDGSIRTKP